MEQHLLTAIRSSGEIESFVARNRGGWDHQKWCEFKEKIQVRFGNMNWDELGLLLEAEKRVYHHLAATAKGPLFERMVANALFDLERQFPERVHVTSQPRFPEALRPHRPDFELQYALGGLTHHHLIECQNRNQSSYAIADKIYAVRGTTNSHRYIVVYNSPDYLSEPVKKRFDDMGVLYFDFEKFQKEFLTQLGADLALHEIGFAYLFNQNELVRTEISDSLIHRASKYNPGRENPPDRAMLSR